MKRMASLVMAIMLCTTAFAARFGDVPSTHWAYNDIEALAAGGLVNGVGNGEFSPDSKFTVSQMAQIIANAKGCDTTANKGEYWWTAAVNYCLEIGCLPNFGAVTPENYDVECSRELAVYMVVTGLGIPAGKTVNGKVTAEYIPDFGYVDMAYRTQILDAYRYGLLNGVDEKHTFKPKNGLARSEACAILNRAGYTTAVAVAKKGEGKSADAIIKDLVATGLFEDVEGKRLVAKDRKYAGLTISYNKKSDFFIITGKEIDDNLIYDSNYNILDENGNIFSKASEDIPYDKNGKFVPASALSYNTRQVVKQVLNIMFPTQGDEAYNAFMDVLTPPHTYAPSMQYPSAVKWLDSRELVITTGDNGYTIKAMPINWTTGYEHYNAKPAATTHLSYQYHVIGSDGFISYEKAYELNKR